jgi:hypothetical protein
MITLENFKNDLTDGGRRGEEGAALEVGGSELWVNSTFFYFILFF